MNKTQPSDIITAIRRNGFKSRKRWGQNFLINKGVVGKIVEAAQLTGTETVLEIGPGFGAMTEPLLAQAKKLVAIEIDPQLNSYLAKHLGGYKNFQLVEGDALALDYTKFLPAEYIVVANLPYNITSPFLQRITRQFPPPERALIMVQWEVARRLIALPGTRDYGSLSVLVQYYFRGEMLFKVSPGSFYPAPQVESGVVRLQRCPFPFPPRDEEFMFHLVRIAFSQRRKMLKGLLASALGFSREQIADAFGQARISENIRGESLSVKDFACLADLLGP